MTQNLLRCQELSQVVREPTSAHAKERWLVETQKCTATYTIGSVKAKGERIINLKLASSFVSKM